MRILRVTQKTYPDVKGGAPYHTYAMSRDQAGMGHYVTLLTVRQDPELPQVEEREGYKIVRYDPVAAPLGNDISPGLAQYLQRADDFDVIHAHSHLYFATNLAALKRAAGGPPLAITNHGLFSQSAPEWVFDLYLRTLGRWTFNQADVVFCYTETDKERVREFGVDARIDVVANGIDPQRFTPEGPESELIDHDGPVVLFVGRLVEGKRPQDAVRAVSRLNEEKDVKLYIVGDGPMREELEVIAGEDVEFLGHMSYDEMPAVYRAGDVLVLPSRAEGLPRTVLEAFASSVPVVSSELEHTAPIVAKGGETVDIGDIDGYVEALKEVYEQRAALAEAGRKLVTEKFRWERTVAETTSELSKIS